MDSSLGADGYQRKQICTDVEARLLEKNKAQVRRGDFSNEVCTDDISGLQV